MIPKEEQLDLGTQPRYTRQWGYNASTGSTSMFRRFADVFNSGAKEETRLRNALRMQIGKDIASQYVSLSADKHRDEMGAAMKERFPNLATYSAGKRLDFDNDSVIRHERSGETTETINKNTNTNFRYEHVNSPGDETPTEGIGEVDTPTAPPAPSTPKAPGAPKAPGKPRNKPKNSGPKSTSTSTTKTVPANPNEDGIPDAEIIEDDKPTTSVAPAPTKKPRTPRPGKQGAVAEDPDANAGRNKPDDVTLQGK